MKLLIETAKAIAVNFAEWLSKNEWIKREKTHPSSVGKYWSHVHCEYKTIEELYELFLVEEQKRLDSLKQ